MKKISLFMMVFCMLTNLFAVKAQNQVSPYKGQETRPIKALSEAEINQLRNVAGMGFAKVAELNHYPGPKHVLELSQELQLTAEQVILTKDAFDKMHQAAVRIGIQIIDQESELETLFAGKSATTERVEQKVASIAELQGKLRLIHLQAHLEMVDILTRKQIHSYVQLRGYAGGPEGHQGHHQHE